MSVNGGAVDCKQNITNFPSLYLCLVGNSSDVFSGHVGIYPLVGGEARGGGARAEASCKTKFPFCLVAILPC